MIDIIHEQKQAAEHLKSVGWNADRIARLLDVDRSTVFRWLAANRSTAADVRRQCDDFAAHCKKLA